MVANLPPLKAIPPAVRDPEMVALPPTNNVLVSGIVAPPVSVDVVLTDSAPVIVAPPASTFSPPDGIVKPFDAEKLPTGAQLKTPEASVVRKSPAEPTAAGRVYKIAALFGGARNEEKPPPDPLITKPFTVTHPSPRTLKTAVESPPTKPDIK